MRHRFVLSGLALSLLSACSGEPSSAPASAPEALASSPQALSLLSSLQQRFVLPAPTLPARPGLDAPAAQGSPRALLGESHAERWTVREGWLRPELPDHRRRGITRPASVRLPLRASGAFEVTDETSGMRLSVTRAGAQAAEVEQAEGWAMYRGGLGAGTDVLHRATAEGTEDFVHFAARPSKEELRYRVDVSAVAGLRLVSNVLEFVNAEGDPRLRLTAPMLVDGAGERRELTIGVEGCAYSSDPAPPWGRAVTEPGASECEVVVWWEAGASYPLVVDPNWTASGNMVKPRRQHTASVLLDGSVLVVGGSNYPDTSEVWKAGTWAASGQTTQARVLHSASVLLDGRVLVVGGSNSPNTSEVWKAGTWIASGQTTQARALHSAVVLPDGRVLVVGGNDSGVDKTSEVWTNGAWTASGNLVYSRSFGHTTSVLPDGRVLVVGGDGSSSNTSEVWTNGVWAGSGATVHPRRYHSAGVLSDGRVLVVGGSESSATSEVWTNGAWGASGNPGARWSHTASVLWDNRVLVVGGQSDFYSKTSAIWTSGIWAASGNLVQIRMDHTASVLPDGRVLVVGGLSSPNTSEVWSEDKPLGQGCSLTGQCGSGFCVDGICCDSACTQPGHACTQAKTGKPSGQCGPSVSGLPCSLGAECGSGFCVDGVCCDKACTGTCEACSAAKKNQGVDGSCGLVAIGFDPDNECQVVGAGTCQSTGFCNGTGKCDSKLGITCAAASCSDTKTAALPASCPANGICPAQVLQPCTPFVCAAGACLSSCSKDTDCQDSFYCDLASKQCLPQNSQPNTPCSTNSQCSTKFCVDGYCCNEACTGTCRACSAEKKGQGLNGVCGDILSNTDPDSECTQQDPLTCGTSGACNGQGQCALFAQGTSCGASLCAAGALTGKVCNGQGQCLDTSTPVPCAPYTGCANATTCASTCSSNNDCVASHFCNTTSKNCEPDKAAGATCESSNECASGFCVDGVCCSTACDGACQACEASLKASGPSGTCGPVKEGSKDAGCAVAGGCGADGSCDEGGTCRTAAAKGAPCGETTCADGVTAGKVCDGAGTCISSSGLSCGAYACSSATNACLTECSTTANCATGYFCSQKACVEAFGAGNVCTSNEQCSGGFCVDGVCCESACEGPCVSCNGNANQSGQSGKCGPVIGGTDPRNACNKDDANPCGKPGVCGDDGECKSFASQGTLCGIKACAGDSLTSKLCDGFGACQQSSDLCPPFACDSEAKACKTKCSSNSDCSTGAVCSTNGQCTLGEASCADKSTAKAPDGSLKKCDPYTCLNGQCRDSCSTDLDCTSDFECNAQQCVPRTAGTAGNGAGGSAGTNAGGTNAGGVGGNGTAPGSEEATGDDGGACGCRAAGSARSEGGAAGLLLGLALAARRRRRPAA